MLNTVHGVEQTPEVLVRAAQIARRLAAADLLARRAAGGAAEIATGLAIGMGVSWFSLLAGEIISGQYGIGYFTWNAYSLIKYPDIVVGMLVIGTLGTLSTMAVRKLSAAVARAGKGRHDERPGRTRRDRPVGATIRPAGRSVRRRGASRSHPRLRLLSRLHSIWCCRPAGGALRSPAELRHRPTTGPATSWRIVAGTGSIADMVADRLDEWLLEIGYMNSDYGRGIAEWSLADPAAKVVLVDAHRCPHRLQFHRADAGRPPAAALVRQSRSPSGRGLMTALGALCANLDCITLIWVVCRSAPTWVVGLAMLGIGVSTAFALEPLGPAVSLFGMPCSAHDIAARARRNVAGSAPQPERCNADARRPMP